MFKRKKSKLQRQEKITLQRTRLRGLYAACILGFSYSPQVLERV